MKTILSRLGLWGVLGFAGLAPIACGAEFEPASRVNDFRLIAVRADKPFAAPGERVELTTLSHEPFGRPITWGWATCVKPRATTANACLAKAAEDGKSLAMGQGMSTFATTIPADVLDGVPPDAAANVLVGIVTVGCPGALTVRDPRTIAQGELPFWCVDANTAEVLTFDRYVVSVKRIAVRHTERNQNPALAGVTYDGLPWAEGEVKEVTGCRNSPEIAIADCDGGEKHELAVVVPPESVESGTSEAGVPFTEDLVVQYYGEDGLFEFDGRTGASPRTTWAARNSAVGKDLTLWFVVRENRGGVTWTTRKVRVR